MRLVDTSAWIEWFANTPLVAQIAPQIPAQADWLVPTIVQFELAKWLHRHVDTDAANSAIAFSTRCVVVTLDSAVALAAADVARVHKLTTADAIIYATAQHHGADLLTCDAHFRGLPDVIYIPKSIGAEP